MKQLIDDAMAAWEGAPMHVRAMAGAYVGPLLAALVAIGERVEALEMEVKNGKQ